MILEIEHHNKVEILGLLKEKYKEKINANLHSVKWVQYDNELPFSLYYNFF
jgi:hypothetical protein